MKKNKLLNSNLNYEGWELKYFDNSKNFRNYQIHLIKKFISGYIAEVGPGNGSNLKSYIYKIKKADLFEPSKNLFNKLKKKFKKNKKVKCYNSSFKSKNKYNAVLYLDVLEHIKNDKKEILNSLKKIKKNGYLIINVPAFSHLYSNFDKDVGHYRRYNIGNFNKILKGLSYSNVEFKYYDVIGYFLSLLSKLILSDYKKNFESKIKFWDSLIWLSRLMDKFLYFNLGKSLLIIIKK